MNRRDVDASDRGSRIRQARVRRGCTACLLTLLLLACQSSRTSTSTSGHESTSILGGRVLARVGGESISKELAVAVAEAQHVEPREALARLVSDALIAHRAHAQGVDREPAVRWKLDATRARFVTDRVFDEAKRQGLPTDPEIDELSKRYWAQVDRPPSVRVIHAVVLHPKDPSKKGAARALAVQLRAALHEIQADAFESRVKEFPRDPAIDVRAERLPAFTEDGWVTEESGRMDEAFAKGAFSLAAPGATSEVVESAFGYHIIRLLERIPELRMPIEARRLAFSDEVYPQRARSIVTQRLNVLRAANRVSIDTAAAARMQSVALVATERAER